MLIYQKKYIVLYTNNAIREYNECLYRLKMQHLPIMLAKHISGFAKRVGQIAFQVGQMFLELANILL